MKKSLKRCFVLTLALCAFFAMTATAYAAESGSVSYEGQSGLFVFSPGSEESPTDLFSGFKDVMPGDTLTDQIVVRNNANVNADVVLYLRLAGTQEDADGFLDQLTLTIRQNGSSELFTGPASDTAQLSDWVSLGTFAHGASVTLDLTLEVPVTLGNEFQDAVGHLTWQFKVEELDRPAAGGTGAGAGPQIIYGEPVTNQPADADQGGLLNTIVNFFTGGAGDGAADAGDAGEDPVDVDENGVPLANEEDDSADPTMDLDDGEVPLAGIEVDGHVHCILHYILLLLAMILEACYIYSRRRGQKLEFERRRDAGR